MQRFLRSTAFMVGVDFHDFLGLSPVPTPLPMELPMFPHVAIAPQFRWILASFQLFTTNVQGDDDWMVQSNFEVYLVPHIPFPLWIPHPLELTMLGVVVGLSDSGPVFAKESVTGQGDPLTTTLASIVGINGNCSDPVDSPLNAVIQTGTVQTSLSWKDIISATVGFVFCAALGAFFAKGAGHLFGKAVKKAASKVIAEDFAEKLGKEAAEQYQEELADWIGGDVVKTLFKKKLFPDAEGPIAEFASELIYKGISSGKFIKWADVGDYANAVLEPLDPTGTNAGAVGEFVADLVGAQ